MSYSIYSPISGLSLSPGRNRKRGLRTHHAANGERWTDSLDMPVLFTSHTGNDSTCWAGGKASYQGKSSPATKGHGVRVENYLQFLVVYCQNHPASETFTPFYFWHSQYLHSDAIVYTHTRARTHKNRQGRFPTTRSFDASFPATLLQVFHSLPPPVSHDAPSTKLSNVNKGRGSFFERKTNDHFKNY